MEEGIAEGAEGVEGDAEGDEGEGAVGGGDEDSVYVSMKERRKQKGKWGG